MRKKGVLILSLMRRYIDGIDRSSTVSVFPVVLPSSPARTEKVSESRGKSVG